MKVTQEEVDTVRNYRKVYEDFVAFYAVRMRRAWEEGSADQAERYNKLRLRAEFKLDEINTVLGMLNVLHIINGDDSPLEQLGRIST